MRFSRTLVRAAALAAALCLSQGELRAQGGSLALTPVDSGVLGNSGSLGGWGLHASVMTHVLRVTTPLEARALGYYQMSANPVDVSFAVTLRTWDGATLGPALASVLVGPGSAVDATSLNHQFVFASVAPVALLPGTVYVLSGTPTGDMGDFWYLANAFTVAPGVVFDESLVGSTTPSGATGGAHVEFGPGLYVGALSQPVGYCTAGTTSNGCSASLGASASPSTSSANACTISVTGVEGQRAGLMFFGIDNSGFAPSPWNGGTSFLCVRAPVQRTAVQSTGGTTGACNGGYALDWNAYRAANPTALGAPWPAGSDLYVQAWFRDPASPGGTHLSNALVLVHAP